MIRNLLAFAISALIFTVVGCGSKPEIAKTEPLVPAPKKGIHADEGNHGSGPHGGLIIEFGTNHAEFLVDHTKKQAIVYILDAEIKNAAPITAEKLLLGIRASSKSPQFKLDLNADPQAGDPAGKSSRFVATHDNFAGEQDYVGTISAMIDGKPYSSDFKELPHGDKTKDDHNRPVTASEKAKDADVYMKPGGIYTLEDIKANGNTTVAVKYKGLKVAHDFKPKAGDKLCPVTMTKSNAELTWIIGGKKYEFCCPPCVEEFVTTAKTKPEEVKAPETYIKK